MSCKPQETPDTVTRHQLCFVRKVFGSQDRRRDSEKEQAFQPLDPRPVEGGGRAGRESRIAWAPGTGEKAGSHGPGDWREGRITWVPHTGGSTEEKGFADS